MEYSVSLSLSPVCPVILVRHKENGVQMPYIFAAYLKKQQQKITLTKNQRTTAGTNNSKKRHRIYRLNLSGH